MSTHLDMDVCTRVRLYRDAAEVKRWHVQRTLRAQTVGAHTFGVITLLRVLLPGVRKEVLLAAMHHDLPELMTGDIPAHIKRQHVPLAMQLEEIEQSLAPLYQDFGLTPEEERALKWCDSMEAVLWCCEEFDMGNTTVKPIVNRLLSWLKQMPAPSHTAHDLLTAYGNRFHHNMSNVKVEHE